MLLSLSEWVVRSYWDISSIRDVLFLGRLMWNLLSCDCYWLGQDCFVFCCRKTAWGWMHLRCIGFWFILTFLIISALNQLWLFFTVLDFWYLLHMWDNGMGMLGSAETDCAKYCLCQTLPTPPLPKIQHWNSPSWLAFSSSRCKSEASWTGGVPEMYKRWQKIPALGP